MRSTCAASWRASRVRMKQAKRSRGRWVTRRPEYIDAMLKAIVGVEIEITRLVGKSKLSQNKDARDIQAPAKH